MMKSPLALLILHLIPEAALGIPLPYYKYRSAPTSSPTSSPSSNPSLTPSYQPSLSVQLSYQPSSNPSSPSFISISNSLENSDRKSTFSPLMISLISGLVCLVGVGLLSSRTSQCRPRVVGGSEDSFDEMRVNEYDVFDTQVFQSEESGNTATVTEERWGQGLPGLGWLMNSYQQRGNSASIGASVSVESEGSSTTSGENRSVSSGTSSEADFGWKKIACPSFY
jgi:hypothetical protein